MAYLKTPATARHFGVSPRTIRNWRKRPGFPPVKLIGATLVLFDVEAVEQWLNKQPAARVDNAATGRNALEKKRAERAHAHA